MPLGAVREQLRAASKEIEDCCDIQDVAKEDWLRGIITQLQYIADENRTDPEALAFPDPKALDTIGNKLEEAIAEVDGDTETHLRRARDNVLLAVARLEESLENQRSR